MERISIIWFVIALIISLDGGGQASTDPTLRLERRYDQLIESPKGTSILVTFWAEIISYSRGECMTNQSNIGIYIYTNNIKIKAGHACMQ